MASESKSTMISLVIPKKWDSTLRDKAKEKSSSKSQLIRDAVYEKHIDKKTE